MRQRSARLESRTRLTRAGVLGLAQAVYRRAYQDMFILERWHCDKISKKKLSMSLKDVKMSSRMVVSINQEVVKRGLALSPISCVSVCKGLKP